MARYILLNVKFADPRNNCSFDILHFRGAHLINQQQNLNQSRAPSDLFEMEIENVAAGNGALASPRFSGRL